MENIEMTWQDFQIDYRKSSQQLSALAGVAPGLLSEHLEYWSVALKGPRLPCEKGNNWRKFAAEVHGKLLNRGCRSFPQWEIEEAVVEIFFGSVLFKPIKEGSSIGFESGVRQLKVPESNLSYAAHMDLPSPDFNPLDPEHPENEARLLAVLAEDFGQEILAYLHPQALLDQVFASEDFKSQRADFVAHLPDGSGFVLEPGDHDASDEVRDSQRDSRFSEEFGFPTIRLGNREIKEASFRENLRERIRFGDTQPGGQTSSSIIEGILATPAIHRIESALLEQLYSTQLWMRDRVTVHIMEREISVAALALASFLLQQEKLHRLHGKKLKPPAIHLLIESFDEDPFIEPCVESLLGEWSVEVEFRTLDAGSPADLVIDVSTQAGMLLAPALGPPDALHVVIRNAPRHLLRPIFPASSAHELPLLGEELEANLEVFLRDIFRKRNFRQGQVAILRSILGEHDTIGLLPTGAGKSICYQLAGLLRPGSTLVVSPIIALIEDQIEGLGRRYHIEAAEGIHSGRQIRSADEIAGLLEHSCFVYVAPERLQRQNFRDALQSAAGLQQRRISLAVIDEAHCVSMWGHDFRPSYLRLAANIREQCSSAVHLPPPILSLTGTASQLVLIDLKRILGIESDERVVRPETFVRKELNYRVLRADPDSKPDLLTKRVFPELKRDLECDMLLASEFGIVFDYVPSKLWKLVGNVAERIRDRMLEADSVEGLDDIPIGIYTGKCPVKSKDGESPGLLERAWDDYKGRVFRRFAAGDIHCLFGNNAVSVGIDNERIRYVVNMSMPQSLEDYYQQAGRAGRARQSSFCYLLFAESKPEENDAWFLGKGKPESKSDVSNAEYFHRQNFPGRDTDQSSLKHVLKTLIRTSRKQPSSREVVFGGRELAEGRESGVMLDADKAERFVGYLIILGIIEDYTLRGMGKRTEICAQLGAAFQKALQAQDQAAAENLVIDGLWSYYNRYLPKSKDALVVELNELREQKAAEGKMLNAAIMHLIEFFYSKIEYQRRSAIRSITEYCRAAANDPAKAADIIRDYFDTSRFSNQLTAMQTGPPQYPSVIEMVGDIKEHAEAEQLFWETGRLLSEIDRGDWQLARSSARMYLGLKVELVIIELVEGTRRHGAGFLVAAACAFQSLREETGLESWAVALNDATIATYADQETRPLCLKAITDPDFPKKLREVINGPLATQQLRYLNDRLDQRYA